MRGNGASRAIVVMAALGAVLLGMAGSPARADTAPPAGVPATVSADLLPTVQIDGVVWSSVVLGSRVYATGSFARARPAGAAAGTNTTARSNLLAFDLNTGALITSWAPGLNAQGMAIAAAADGSRIFVGGDFSVAGGQTRNRIVALDPTSGAVVSSFNPSFNGRIRALAVSGGTVYAGGTFTTVAGQARQRLVALDAGTGAVLPWNPGADAEVLSLAAPAGANRLVVGGRFTTLAAGSAYGLGSVNATTGAVQSFPANTVVRNARANAGIWSLSSDGTQVYGTGYTFGTGGNFEGTFAADAATGALTWVAGCLGDTYAAFPIGPVLYTVGHNHDCGPVGGMPEQNPRGYNRAEAFTTTADRMNVGGPFGGRASASILHWYPTVDSGTYTGQGQGTWTVTGTSQYVVLAGEFPKINGVNQQGLARFAVSGSAPNVQGPQAASELTPTLSNPSFGRVNLTWKSSWDRDNQRLSYDVLRGNSTVSTVTADSVWWSRPSVSAADTSAPGGSQTYRIRTRDGFGNSVTGPPITLNVNGPTTPPPAGGVIATDDFTRTTGSGWSSATTGQGWTISGGSVTSSVTGGSGVLNVPAGKRATAVLDVAPIASSEVLSTFWLDAAATGGGVNLSSTARQTAAGDYRARLKIAAGGTITANLSRYASGTDNVIGGSATLPFGYTAGSKVLLKVQATGAAPTTVQMKAWPQGTAEPAGWLLTATDGTSGMQGTGRAGVDVYVSGSATTPATLHADDLQVTAL